MAKAKTKIEWCDYTANPMRGLCPMGCSYCYAWRMTKRFKLPERIEYAEGWDRFIAKIKKPSRIFVGSMMELFGCWIPQETMQYIFKVVRQYPQHTFIFLTKQPDLLKLYSPFPDNAWIGVTIDQQRYSTGYYQHTEPLSAIEYLRSCIAKVKILSLEPLLGPLVGGLSARWWGGALRTAGINWVIIGRQRPYSAKTAPKIEWISDIVEAAEYAGAAVFLKDNLYSLLDANDPLNPKFWSVYNDERGHERANDNLRQEFPDQKSGLWLCPPTSAKVATSLHEKALMTIEELTCNDDFSMKETPECKLLCAIYRYAHIGLGRCQNPHEEWARELDQVYEKIAKRDAK